MNKWWEKPEIVSQIVDWSYGLQQAHPHQRILSLGQSAAWIVAGVGMIRKLRGRDTDIGYIPFTGAFFTRESDSESAHMEFDERPLERPPTDRLLPYFALLSGIKAQPKDFAAERRKVVIAEMIVSGNGLASFLDVMTRNDLDGYDPSGMANVHFYAYDTNPVANKGTLRIPGHDVSVGIERVALSREQADLMENITPHNRADDTSSRLVSMYRLAASAGEKGLEIIPNQEIRAQIKAALHREIQKREQAGQRRVLEI